MTGPGEAPGAPDDGSLPESPTAVRPTFDGTHPGSILPPPPPSLSVQPPVPPPPPPWLRFVPVPPPITDEVRALPLTIRGLVRESLDVLTRSDNGLRGASFYIGFIMLVGVAPVVTLLVLALLAQAPYGGGGFGPREASVGEGLGWVGWLFLASAPGGLAYIAASVEAQGLATAVIGARAEGRPLRLAASIAVVRKRFWQLLGAQLLIGLVTGAIGVLATILITAALGPVEAITYGVSLLLGLLLGAPVVYVPVAIVLGGTGVVESIRRSFRLARARKGLALVVTVFGLVSQLVVLLGVSAGLDAVARFVIGTGLAEHFPAPLAVPVTAAFVFATGTLVFLVELVDVKGEAR